MNNYLQKIKENINKNKKKLIIGTSVLTLAVVGLGVSTVTFAYNKAKSNTNYTQEQAKEIALGSIKGQVVKVNKELELENCSFEYKFKIKDEKNILREVTVDAKLGAITDLDND